MKFFVFFSSISVLTVVSETLILPNIAVSLMTDIYGIVANINNDTAQQVAVRISETTTESQVAKLNQCIQALELEKSEEPNNILKQRTDEAIFQLDLVKSKLLNDDVFKQLRISTEVLGKVFQQNAEEGSSHSAQGFTIAKMVREYVIKELEKEIAVREITRQQLAQERLSVMEEYRIMENDWKNQTLITTTQLLMMKYQEQALLLQGGLDLCNIKLTEALNEQKAVNRFPALLYDDILPN